MQVGNEEVWVFAINIWFNTHAYLIRRFLINSCARIQFVPFFVDFITVTGLIKCLSKWWRELTACQEGLLKKTRYIEKDKPSWQYTALVRNSWWGTILSSNHDLMIIMVEASFAIHETLTLRYLHFSFPANLIMLHKEGRIWGVASSGTTSDKFIYYYMAHNVLFLLRENWDHPFKTNALKRSKAQ